MIARALNRYKIVVNKSTVPVGTGELVRDIIRAESARAATSISMLFPIRNSSAKVPQSQTRSIRTGLSSEPLTAKLRFGSLSCTLLWNGQWSPRTWLAEMIKYASNAFLATKISFINAVANICTDVGADITQVMKGMGYDQRIGSAFCRPAWGMEDHVPERYSGAYRDG